MLFIFDLDFTLWNCGGTWCDQTQPPYKKVNSTQIVDSQGLFINLYPETLNVLKQLKEQGVKMCVASRTSAPEWAMQLMNLFGLDNYFECKEIYPGSKIVHMSAIKSMTGIAFKKMFFFDDEHRNIEEVSSLNVNCYFIEDGINQGHIEKALEKYAEIS